MMRVYELREWLQSLDYRDNVAIDEGGLSLVLVGEPEVYIEIGGEPEEDEAEQIQCARCKGWYIIDDMVDDYCMDCDEALGCTVGD